VMTAQATQGEKNGQCDLHGVSFLRVVFTKKWYRSSLDETRLSPMEPALFAQTATFDRPVQLLHSFQHS